MSLEPVANFGPNEVVVIAIPGEGDREVIDTRYEVQHAYTGEWETVGKFSDRYRAEAYAVGFKDGYAEGAKP